MNKPLTKKELDILRFIRNKIVHIGKAPSIREIMDEFNYKSPNAANFVVQKLIKLKILERKSGGSLRILNDTESNKQRAKTVNIPLLGSIPCGQPSLAKTDFEAMIPVSNTLIKNGYSYFFLRASGDSMNTTGIKDGDLVLIRRQPTANEGDRVVAIIDDDATIKKIHFSENNIVLKPSSTNKKHKPIVLERDFIIQGIVVAVLPNFEH